MIKDLIEALDEKQELNAEQVSRASHYLLDESGDIALKALFLEKLTSKGETPTEITYFVENFLEYSINPHFRLLDLKGPSLDIVGTGGDKLNLFNVSTTAMFISAGAGAVVTKHGNRGATAKSGGADVLEALGVPITLPPHLFRECMEYSGCGFLFAPIYHPSFKVVAPVRKELGARGIRTIFNLIGPLMNPVRPECQLIGVVPSHYTEMFAEILQRLGRYRAWVVSGETEDGRSVDEVSLMGPTKISSGGLYMEQKTWSMHPSDLGLPLAPLDELVGGEAEENAIILENILLGKDRSCRRDMACLNAGCALVSAGLAHDLEGGLKLAYDTIDSGAAIEPLRRLQEFGQKLQS